MAHTVSGRKLSGPRQGHLPPAREGVKLPSNIIPDSELCDYTTPHALAVKAGATIQRVARALIALQIPERFDRAGKRIVHKNDLPAILQEVRR